MSPFGTDMLGARRACRTVAAAAVRAGVGASAGVAPLARAPALAAPWLAPWRAATASTSSSSSPADAERLSNAERRKRERRTARRAERQSLRAWLTDEDAWWDVPAPGPRARGGRRRRWGTASWATEALGEAGDRDAAAAFYAAFRRADRRRTRDDPGAGPERGERDRPRPKGKGGTARVKYKHRARGGSGGAKTASRPRGGARDRDAPPRGGGGGGGVGGGGGRRRKASEGSGAEDDEEDDDAFDDASFDWRAAYEAFVRAGRSARRSEEAFSFGGGGFGGFGGGFEGFHEGFHEYTYRYEPPPGGGGGGAKTARARGAFPGDGGACPHRAALGISRSASLDPRSLKAALRASAKRWHPDGHASSEAKAEAEARFKRCYDAYDALAARL